MIKTEDRTFGIELEFGDIVKDDVTLPDGYSWNKAEKSIVNSNGKRSTPAGKIGGEINSPPLLPCRKDLRQLRSFIKHCYDKGGLNMWNLGFDGHIYIGDLGLEELKKIFTLAYYVAPLINGVFNSDEWFWVEHLVPTPNFMFYERVKNAQTLEALKKFSDYTSNFIVREMSYKDIESQVKSLDNFLILSRNNFLPFFKIAKDLDQMLYSTVDCYQGTRPNIKKPVTMPVKTPEDDYKITKDSKIKVQEIQPTYFSVLQQKFVKKVTKFTQPRICYVITDGDLILGAFGFDYPKDRKYSMWLLSDFCTNNNVRLLSKLVLFIIKSTFVKEQIEKKLVERVTDCYTKIYTTQPVSMKYRGAFNKVKSDEVKCLTYDFQFGEGGTIQDAINEYLKRLK